MLDPDPICESSVVQFLSTYIFSFSQVWALAGQSGYLHRFNIFGDNLKKITPEELDSLEDGMGCPARLSWILFRTCPVEAKSSSTIISLPLLFSPN